MSNPHFKKLSAFLLSGMLLLASCGPAVERPVHVAPTTEVTPLPQEGTLEQQSVLSWLIKQGVKKVGKEQFKKALKEQIKDRLHDFRADKAPKEILQEADKLLSMIDAAAPDGGTDLIGLVPVVGDAFDLVKFAQASPKFKEIFTKLDKLNSRTTAYLAKRKPVPAHEVRNLFDGMKPKYKSELPLVGKHKFAVPQPVMEHILVRHHPKYWDGTLGTGGQSFLDEKMTISEIKRAIHTVLKQNQSIIDASTDGIPPLYGTYKGVRYRVAFSYDSVKQFYPIY